MPLAHMAWRGLLYFFFYSVVLYNSFIFSLRGFLSIILLCYSFSLFIYLISLPDARTLACHTAKLAIGQVGQQGRGNLHTSRRYVWDSETDVDDKRAR